MIPNPTTVVAIIIIKPKPLLYSLIRVIPIIPPTVKTINPIVALGNIPIIINAPIVQRITSVVPGKTSKKGYPIKPIASAKTNTFIIRYYTNLSF